MDIRDWIQGWVIKNRKKWWWPHTGRKIRGFKLKRLLWQRTLFLKYLEKQNTFNNKLFYDKINAKGL